MLNARFVPLGAWPGPRTPPARRKYAQFKTQYLKTLDRLEYELDKLHATDILIQAGFTRSQIRNDGWPVATAKPTDLGVIVSFDSPKGALSFPCDTYWQYADNLHAIALALEALRAVDRYGVTRGNEQYKGWAQIAPPSDQPFATKEAAALFLLTQAYPDGAQQMNTGLDHLIVANGTAILCLRCGEVSHHPSDVAQRYCGACHMFHDVQRATPV